MKTPKIILIIAFLLSSMALYANDPPPPPAGHGATGNQDPKGAPVDGGLGILLAIGAAYGGMKLYKARKTANKEEPVEG